MESFGLEGLWLRRMPQPTARQACALVAHERRFDRVHTIKPETLLGSKRRHPMLFLLKSTAKSAIILYLVPGGIWPMGETPDADPRKDTT
jgi:hypothetical protein